MPDTIIFVSFMAFIDMFFCSYEDFCPFVLKDKVNGVLGIGDSGKAVTVIAVLYALASVLQVGGLHRESSKCRPLEDNLMALLK